jgi:hypothetical protein
VELSVPMRGGLTLRIADGPCGDAYPTARLQKGLVLLRRGQDLAGEGVGFGVPVLKHGALTVFPGGMSLAERRDGSQRVIAATFEMDLVERLSGPGGRGPTSQAFYAVRDGLAALHRRVPLLRGLLTTISNAVRRWRAWETTFERIAPVASLAVTYRVDDAEDRVRIAVDLSGLPPHGVSEIAVMNELGAGTFDLYLDSDGARLRGRRIGTWDEVRAASACFAGTTAGVAFRVRQAPGAKLYRGREVVGSRLAWAGFGYSLRPSSGTFAYDVHIERAP